MALGASELLPAVAILPFMIYELGGFGTLSYILAKPVNWIINALILCLIIASYIEYRLGDYHMEKRFGTTLVAIMAITVFYGVLRLKRMQEIYDASCPPKASK